MNKETLYLKKLILLSVLLAISFAIAKWQIPFPLPPYNFLKFDLSETPLVISVFLYPEFTIITALVYTTLAFMIYDPVGALFKVFAVISLILPIGMGKRLFKKNLDAKHKPILLFGIAMITRIVAMVGINYYLLEIKDIYHGISMPLIYYILIIPVFNLIQAGINVIVSYFALSYIYQTAAGER